MAWIEKSFGPTAFTCEQFNCPRSVIGFSTEAFLQTHRTRHGPPLTCFDGCRMNDVGFSSINVLRAHRRKHHAPESRPDVPENFHKRVLSQSMSDDTSTSIKRLTNSATQPINSEDPYPIHSVDLAGSNSTQLLPEDFDFDAFIHGDTDEIKLNYL